MSATEDPQIAALLREREGYVRYGKDDRVEAVDAELKRRGYKADDRPAPAKKAAEKPAKKSAAPAGRTSAASQQSTAAKKH